MQFSRERIVVASVSTGGPRKTIGEKTETIEFTIYGFEEREERPNECLLSPVARAHGYEWQLEVFPRGRDEMLEILNCDNEAYLACYLHLLGNETDVTASFAVGCQQFGEQVFRAVTRTPHRRNLNRAPARLYRLRHHLSSAARCTARSTAQS